MQAVCLQAIAQGMPQLADFQLQQLPVPVPAAGQLLVRLHWLSLDPFLRAQLGGRYVSPCPPLVPWCPAMPWARWWRMRPAASLRGSG